MYTDSTFTKSTTQFVFLAGSVCGSLHSPKQCLQAAGCIDSDPASYKIENTPPCMKTSRTCSEAIGVRYGSFKVTGCNIVAKQPCVYSFFAASNTAGSVTLRCNGEAL